MDTMGRNSSLSQVPVQPCLVARIRQVQLRMRETVVCHRRDGVRGFTQAITSVVPYHVALDGTEDRREREEFLRDLWLRQLSDNVGMVSEAPQCNGKGKS